MKFYKKDLVNIVSDETGIYKKEIEEVVNSIIHNIPKILNEGDRLYFSEFGCFSCEETKGRYGINPKTGERIFIPSRKKLKFKASEVVYK